MQSWTNNCTKTQEVNKTVFSVDYFTTDFSQYLSTNVKICLVSNRMKTKIIYAKLIQQLYGIAALTK